MADAGILGVAPATFFSETPLGEVENRLSTQLSSNERRDSVPRGRRQSSVIDKVLVKTSLEEKFDYARRHSRITANDLEVIRAAKQIEREVFAAGGQVRYYEPIDSYEGNFFPTQTPLRLPNFIALMLTQA